MPVIILAMITISKAIWALLDRGFFKRARSGGGGRREEENTG